MRPLTTPSLTARVARAITLAGGIALVGIIVFLAARLAPFDEPLQPTSGTGWRLLAELRAGDPYSVEVATDEVQVRTMQRGLDNAPLGPVAFAHEIVVRFGTGTGSSCPEIHFGGIVVRPGIMYPDITFPSPPFTIVRQCTADLFPHSFVVAIERGILPESPFVVQLSEDIEHYSTRARVTVDLAP